MVSVLNIKISKSGKNFRMARVLGAPGRVLRGSETGLGAPGRVRRAMGSIGVVFGWSRRRLRRILRKSFALAWIGALGEGGGWRESDVGRAFPSESIGIRRNPSESWLPPRPPLELNRRFGGSLRCQVGIRG